MSPLTKLFVVLLIVCSLLLTASVVIFVNQTQDFRKWGEDAEMARKKSERDVAQANAAESAAKAREMEAIASANATVAALQQERTAMSQKLAEADSAVNKLKSDLLIKEGNISEMVAAIKTSQQNVSDTAKRNEALIAEADKLRIQSAELTGANTDLQKRLDEAERERRFTSEQLSQAKSDVDRLQALVKERGIAPSAAMAKKPGSSTPDLKGVISSVKTEDGQTYAQISLGSADKVEKGMELIVIDPVAQQFLGKFIVDSVDTNTSFGRLEGPRVQDVKANNTQVVSKL